jgi:hypothetical protein
VTSFQVKILENKARKSGQFSGKNTGKQGQEK